MFGTAQENRTGSAVKEEAEKMKIGTYEYVLFQHKTMPLCLVVWSDNNLVKTLYNYCTPNIQPSGLGVLRKKKGADGKREMSRSPVPCPQHNRDCIETFRIINKGHGIEAKYDLVGKIRTHNWCPKLCMKLFNMGLNNEYQIYDALVEKYTPGRRFLGMEEALQEMTHFFCQQGDVMRSQRVYHPLHIRDMTNVFDVGIGRKVQ